MSRDVNSQRFRNIHELYNIYELHRAGNVVLTSQSYLAMQNIIKRLNDEGSKSITSNFLFRFLIFYPLSPFFLYLRHTTLRLTSSPPQNLGLHCYCYILTSEPNKFTKLEPRIYIPLHVGTLEGSLKLLLCGITDEPYAFRQPPSYNMYVLIGCMSSELFFS